MSIATGTFWLRCQNDCLWWINLWWRRLLCLKLGAYFLSSVLSVWDPFSCLTCSSVVELCILITVIKNDPCVVLLLYRYFMTPLGKLALKQLSKVNICGWHGRLDEIRKCQNLVFQLVMSFLLYISARYVSQPLLQKEYLYQVALSYVPRKVMMNSTSMCAKRK